MKKLKGVVSHHQREVEELRNDPGLMVEYLQAAMESLDNQNQRAAGLLALQAVAEAHGGLRLCRQNISVSNIQRSGQKSAFRAKSRNLK